MHQNMIKKASRNETKRRKTKLRRNEELLTGKLLFFFCWCFAVNNKICCYCCVTFCFYVLFSSFHHLFLNLPKNTIGKWTSHAEKNYENDWKIVFPPLNVVVCRTCAREYPKISVNLIRWHSALSLPTCATRFFQFTHVVFFFLLFPFLPPTPALWRQVFAASMERMEKLPAHITLNYHSPSCWEEVFRGNEKLCIPFIRSLYYRSRSLAVFMLIPSNP